MAAAIPTFANMRAAHPYALFRFLSLRRNAHLRSPGTKVAEIILPQLRTREAKNCVSKRGDETHRSLGVYSPYI